MPRKKNHVSQYTTNSRGWNSGNNFSAANPVKGIATTGNAGFPGKVKCGICLKWKQPHNFSNRQMKLINTNIRRFGPEAGVATLTASCSSCMSGGNRLEWTCAQCHECKDIDSFSKAQRGRGDDAICQECMAQVMDLEPTEGAGRHDDHNEDESDSDYDSDDDDVTTITNSINSYSINTGGSSNVAEHWDAQGVSVEQFLENDLSTLGTGSVVTNNGSNTSSKAEAAYLERRNGEIGFDDSASQAGSRYKKSNYTQSITTGGRSKKWAKIRASDPYQDPNPPAANSGSFAAIKAVGTAAALEYRNNSRYGGGSSRGPATARSRASGAGPGGSGTNASADRWGKAKPSYTTASNSVSYGAEPLDDSDDDDDDDSDWATQVYDYRSGEDESD